MFWLGLLADFLLVTPHCSRVDYFTNAKLSKKKNSCLKALQSLKNLPLFRSTNAQETDTLHATNRSTLLIIMQNALPDCSSYLQSHDLPSTMPLIG